MSRLTASPFHKPSPFVFPREPISPPETLTDSGYPTTTGLPQGLHEPRLEEPAPFANVEAHLHSRTRGPSISYHNSGFREPPNRNVHRSYRFFVVVIPPPRLIEEHGQLGHTLASGPPQRLSQGIIMPLFPTMYGQLTAIAKEFNFPSTTGLCLYLHFNENGVVMTPRISDESWHMLWSHLFESPSTPRGPPIGGKIEFDIDFQQARWYSSWLSTLIRDNVERPLSRVPSSAPSVAHIRGPSRTSIGEDISPESDNLGGPHFIQSRSVPDNPRHVPKKLSLVDRFDFPANRPESKINPAWNLELPDQGPSASKALSPIAQEEEPQSARDELDDRVKSWRAAAVVKPTSLTGRGQPSLDPINLPNNVSLDEDTSSGADAELNLEDFTWSISSVGPEDYDIMSIETFSERLPSPDMALRMFYDCPPTPLTATTWGAPLSYPPSPLSDYRPPSLDLGFRTTFSAPLTPATATSWGPLSPTISADDWYQEIRRPASIHLGDRGDFSRPVTPSTATTWGAPLSYPPTPITPYQVKTPDVAQRSFDYAHEHGVVASRSHPQSHEGRPWHLVWPYFRARGTDVEPVKETKQALGYPYISIYPPVYPHFDLYPAAAASNMREKTQSPPSIKVSLCPEYPVLQIYAPVYPYNLDVIYPEVHGKEDKVAPVLATASQHPTFNLNPAVPMLAQNAPVVPSPCSGYSYPVFNIYPAVYPHFDLYPPVDYPSPAFSVGSRGSSYGVYPNLVIYPAVYPHFNIYPGKAAEVLEAVVRPKQTKVTLPVQYPKFDLYPAVYPHFNIYPSSQTVAQKSTQHPPIVVSSSQYPVFDLYPAVYPHFNLYPPKAGEVAYKTLENVADVSSIVVQSDSYPVIRPYPPVYPHFDLYPATTLTMTVAKSMKELPVLLPRATAYPTFNLYPPIYPHLSLYPPIAGAVEVSQRKKASSQTVSSYPFLQIYTPVYPHLSIYPPIAASQIVRPSPQSRAANRNISATSFAQPKPAIVRKSHSDLHHEVFHNGPVRTPSGTSVRLELDLRALQVPPRHSQRRIVATRSPTGPALRRPATPPALPSPTRKLPTPPAVNGNTRSPNVLEQMAGYRAEASPTRRHSPVICSPSRTAVTATQRASMMSPLRQMPAPRSAEMWKYPDDALATTGTVSSGLNRARSAGNGGRNPSIKTRVRDSFIAQRAYGL